MYGGQPGAQQRRDFPMQAQNVNARGNPVRAAQPQVIQQLIGGDDDMDEFDEGVRHNPWVNSR